MQKIAGQQSDIDNYKSQLSDFEQKFIQIKDALLLKDT
jgi:hypothetical protein